MHDYTLAHLSDSVLLRDLATLVGQDRLTTAKMLAHIAEVDSRRLYAPAGHSSMHAYCVGELHLSDDAAYKRIQAARAARQFPMLFEAVAEGRLHLAAICLLAPHLTADNAEELIGAATHRRKSEIEAWLARRLAPLVAQAVPRTVVRPVMPARPREAVASRAATARPQLALGQVEVESRGPASAETDSNSKRVDAEPPAPERYLVQVTISKAAHDKLRHAQALLSHAVPAGDVPQVLERALDALIAQLEKRKFGAGSQRQRPARGLRESRTALSARSEPIARRRHIPAQVRRAVWERDQGRCTFVSTNGTRCQALQFLEFDHIEPVARGGRTTVAGMRLRCRTHNQYEAERVFGVGFMSRKRHEAPLAAEGARAAVAEARAQAAAQEQSRVGPPRPPRPFKAPRSRSGCAPRSSSSAGD